MITDCHIMSEAEGNPNNSTRSNGIMSGITASLSPLGQAYSPAKMELTALMAITIVNTTETCPSNQLEISESNQTIVLISHFTLS